MHLFRNAVENQSILLPGSYVAPHENKVSCFGNGSGSEHRTAVPVACPWKRLSHLTSVSSRYRRMPSLLEYVSYTCNFMGILAGPLCSYKDYITFIEGRPSHMSQASENGKEEQHHERADPSPNVRARDSPGALCLSVWVSETV